MFTDQRMRNESLAWGRHMKRARLLAGGIAGAVLVLSMVEIDDSGASALALWGVLLGLAAIVGFLALGVIQAVVSATWPSAEAPRAPELGERVVNALISWTIVVWIVMPK
jgi:hypothetical protein